MYNLVPNSEVSRFSSYSFWYVDRLRYSQLSSTITINCVVLRLSPLLLVVGCVLSQTTAGTKTGGAGGAGGGVCDASLSCYYAICMCFWSQLAGIHVTISISSPLCC